MLKKKLLILSLSGFLILAGFLIAGQVRALTDGVWNDEGNVGIGTTDPGTYRLNVSGDANFNTLYVDQVKLLDLPSNNPERGPWNPIWNIAGSSKPLYFDEEFSGGNNGVTVYNNSGETAVTITRLTGQTGVPNSTGVVLRISYDGVGPVSPNFGGFLLSFSSSPNKTYVQRFRAKVPVGKTLNINENSQGTNNTSYWLTSNVGTGKWEDYIRISHAGNTGTFSSGGHVSVSGGSGAFDWYLASANVYEVNTPIIASANTWRSVQDFASTIRGEGAGTYTAVPGAGTDSVSNAALVIDRGDYIYTEGNGYLRGLIGGDSSGNIMIGQTGTSLVPSISLRAGNAGYIDFYSGGSETMRVTGGNVGIGLTNPGAKLEVNGSVIIGATVFSADNHAVTKGYVDSAVAGGSGSGVNADLLDSIDSVRFIYGSNGSGSNRVSATQNVYELPQYKSGFWDSTGASWTPDTGWWWGATFAHKSNSASYNYSGQLAFRVGGGGNGIYARTISAGTPTAWSRLLSTGSNVASSGNLLITGSGNHYISAGNVGIGTTNPTRLLEVKKASVGEIAFFNDGTQGLLLQTSSGVGSVIGYNGASYNAIDIRTVAGVGSGVYLSTSGNIGIGTTNPGVGLDINKGTSAAVSTTATPNGSLNIGSSSTTGVLNIGVNGGTYHWMQARNRSSATWYPLVLNPNGGNVGIGTTAPGYLLDVAGTVRTQGDFLANANYGLGLVGVYSATRYQNVFAMGTAYRLSADGTSAGNLYGIAWTHSNIGGQSKSGLSHQALFMNNGTTQTAIGTGIWTLGGYTQSGSSANTFTGPVTIPAPTAATHAASKDYVDTTIAGIGSGSSAWALSTNKLYPSSSSYEVQIGTGGVAYPFSNGKLLVNAPMASGQQPFTLYTGSSQGIDQGSAIGFAGNIYGSLVPKAFIAARAAETSPTSTSAYLQFAVAQGEGGSPTERMRIKYNGYIGIGTTNPVYKLDVSGDMRASRVYANSGVTLGANMITSGNWISGDGGDEGITVDSAGRVGIGTGTSTLSNALTVDGRIKATSPSVSTDVATKGYVDDQLIWHDSSIRTPAVRNVGTTYQASSNGFVYVSGTIASNDNGDYGYIVLHSSSTSTPYRAVGRIGGNVTDEKAIIAGTITYPIVGGQYYRVIYDGNGTYDVGNTTTCGSTSCYYFIPTGVTG